MPDTLLSIRQKVVRRYKVTLFRKTTSETLLHNDFGCALGCKQSKCYTKEHARGLNGKTGM